MSSEFEKQPTPQTPVPQERGGSRFSVANVGSYIGYALKEGIPAALALAAAAYAEISFMATMKEVPAMAKAMPSFIVFAVTGYATYSLLRHTGDFFKITGDIAGELVYPAAGLAWISGAALCTFSVIDNNPAALVAGVALSLPGIVLACLPRKS